MDAEQPRSGIPGLIAALRDHWAAALVGALVVLIPGAFVILTQSPDYRSEAVVGLVPKRFSSDSFLRAVAQQIPVSLSSPQVTAEVGQPLGLSGTEVRRATTVEIPAATLNLSIVAVTPDPQQSAALANGLAAEAIANKTYGTYFTSLLLSPAVPAEKPSGLGRAVLIPIVLILAFALASVFALSARDMRSLRRE